MFWTKNPNIPKRSATSDRTSSVPPITQGADRQQDGITEQAHTHAEQREAQKKHGTTEQENPDAGQGAGGPQDGPTEQMHPRAAPDSRALTSPSETFEGSIPGSYPQASSRDGSHPGEQELRRGLEENDLLESGDSKNTVFMVLRIFLLVMSFGILAGQVHLLVSIRRRHPSLELGEYFAIIYLPTFLVHGIVITMYHSFSLWLHRPVFRLNWEISCTEPSFIFDNSKVQTPTESWVRWDTAFIVFYVLHASFILFCWFAAAIEDWPIELTIFCTLYGVTLLILVIFGWRAVHANRRVYGNENYGCCYCCYCCFPIPSTVSPKPVQEPMNNSVPPPGPVPALRQPYFPGNRDLTAGPIQVRHSGSIRHPSNGTLPIEASLRRQSDSIRRDPYGSGALL